MSESAVNSTLMKKLLVQANGGDKNALGTLLEIHRGYLRAITERELGGKLDARMDPSDLIQQTCLSALKNFPAFQGDRIPEFIVWLRQIHQRNLHDAVREHVRAARRTVKREQRLDIGGEARIEAVQKQSPSERAMAGEAAVVLTLALEKLPDDQREAIRLRHLEGLPLAEISDRMGRSPTSVAGLLKRGLQGLREGLAVENQGKQ